MDLNYNQNHKKLKDDFNDGDYIKKRLKPNELAILIYTDDLELTNAIDTRRTKHKLSMKKFLFIGSAKNIFFLLLAMFYWCLLNLPSSVRYNLCNMKLLSVSKSEYLNSENITRLLQNFVEISNKLNKEDL